MVIVDDSDVYRVGLRALRGSENFKVVAEAGDGSCAVPLILGLSLSLVLLDIMLLTSRASWSPTIWHRPVIRAPLC